MSGGTKDQNPLGAAIRQIREREGLTQEDLAFKASLDATWISAIERERRDPRWSTICQIAEGLGVTAVELAALAERLKT